MLLNYARCMNGGVGKNPNTYYLCEDCSKAAPNAVAMGLVRVPENASLDKNKTFNANYLGLYVRCKST